MVGFGWPLLIDSVQFVSFFNFLIFLLFHRHACTLATHVQQVNPGDFKHKMSKVARIHALSHPTNSSGFKRMTWSYMEKSKFLILKAQPFLIISLNAIKKKVTFCHLERLEIRISECCIAPEHLKISPQILLENLSQTTFKISYNLIRD